MSDNHHPQQRGAAVACPGETGPEPACNASRRRLLQGIGASAVLLGMPASLWAMSGSPKDAITPFISKDELAAKLAAEFKLPLADVRAALRSAEFAPDIIRRMQTPYESRPYTDYRPLFVNDRLAGLGHAYLLKHRDLFAETEKKYGVEKEIIAAILGMETHYGVNRGRDSVLGSLYTLAAGYPRRADFFRSELGHFLLLCQEEKLNPEDPVGSYAGAFGTTQFIPSSYRHFAVDADGDGKRDVWDSPADIIASVANYFHEHQWEAGKPVAYWLPQAYADQPAALREQAEKGFKSWKTVADFTPMLTGLPDTWSQDDKATIIDMQTSHGRKLALVHYNFYVITRWNRSYNYAMAITELAALLDCKLCRTGW